jgi:hypothetical protein
MKFKIYYLTFLLLLLGNTFLTAQNSNYKADWINQYGTDGGDDKGIAVGTDSIGNIYTLIEFGGLTAIGSDTIVGEAVIKYDATGNIIWNIRNDSSNLTGFPTEIRDMAVSKSGFVYLCGSINKGDKSVEDIFLKKISPLGHLVWEKKFLGDTLSLPSSSPYEYANKIKVDMFENIYLGGGYTSTGIDFGNGNYVSGGDIFFTKLDSTGNSIWAKSIGQPIASFTIDRDNINTIHIDDSNNIYIGGEFFSLLMDFGNGNTVFNSGGKDCFITKYDSSGTSLWTKSINSTNNESVFSLISNSTGNIAALLAYDGNGSFFLDNSDTIFINNTSNYSRPIFINLNTTDGIVNGIEVSGFSGVDYETNQISYQNNKILYSNTLGIYELNITGQVIDTIYIKASYNNYHRDFFVTQSGETVIVGNTNNNNNSDFFILKQGNNNQIIWSDTLGGLMTYYSISDMTTDNLGNIYFLHRYTAQNNYSTRLIKLNPNGDTIWTKPLFVSFDNSHILIDNQNNIYLISSSSVVKLDALGNQVYFQNGNFNLTSFDAKFGIYNDIFVVGEKNGDLAICRINSFNGATLWSKTYGGTGHDQINAMEINPNGRPIITGYFESPNIYFANAGITLTNQGGRDFLLAKVELNGDIYNVTSEGNTGNDEGRALAIDSSGNIFVGGVFDSPSLTFNGSWQHVLYGGGGTTNSFIAKYYDFIYWAGRVGHIGTTYSVEITEVDIDANDHLYIQGVSPLPSLFPGYIFLPHAEIKGNFILKLGDINTSTSTVYDTTNIELLKNYNGGFNQNSYYYSANVLFENKMVLSEDGKTVIIAGNTYGYGYSNVRNYYFDNGITYTNYAGTDGFVAKYSFNDYPTSLSLNNNITSENIPTNSFIGIFNSTDQDTSDTFIYSLISGTGDTGNSSFHISNDSLFTDTTFNYEVQNTYSIRVQTDDGNGGAFEMLMTIHISDTNDLPTNLMSVDTIISESQPLGTMVGLLSTTDEDVADSHIYSLVTGTGDTDNGLFSISNDTLKSQTTFDFETQNTLYSIRVKTDDGNGGTYERVFTIVVQDINDVPDTFQLSNHITAENQPIGTAVSTLSTTDQDVSDVHTYSLVTGTGNIDNSKFSINGTNLETAIILDFEAQNSYSIRLQTNDGNGGVLQQVFVITATDNNDIPILISSTDTTVTENQPTGTVVATLSTTDQDVSDVHTYSLVTGTGDTDNSKFNINGTDLETATILDFEAQNSYSIRIKTDDGNGGFLEQIFTILATDNNDMPILVNSTDTTIAENQPIGTVVGTLSTTDQDVSDIHNYSLVTGTGAIDNTQFSINGNNLETATILDYETQNSFSIRIKTDDGNGGILEQIFTILATDNNDVPSQLNMTDTAIVENVHVGEFVTLLSTIDQDISDIHSYSFVSGFGDTDNNDFFVTVDSLFSNVEFDFEAKNSYSIRLQTDDGNGGTLQKAFLINVIDITQEPVNTMNQLDVESLRLFPNPTNNILIIEVNLATSKKNVSIDLTDVLGQQIWKNIEETNVQNLKHQFDVSEIPAGTYFLRILADGQVLTKKVIVQH